MHTLKHRCTHTDAHAYLHANTDARANTHIDEQIYVCPGEKHIFPDNDIGLLPCAHTPKVPSSSQRRKTYKGFK